VTASDRGHASESAPVPGGAAARPPPGAQKAAPYVEVLDAGVHVGGRPVWEHVTFSVSPGEFVAVLGPNGAGKSTLLKTLLGLVPVTSGTVRVGDRRPGAANHDIGYLPQRRSFDPSLRVRGVDIVRLGLDGDRWGVPLARGKQARARVAELIDLVDATELAARPIGQLSGGEQQRLLIAQALARRPRLLLLDEPLDSLDLTNQGSIAALVDRISREEGLAVIIVAHDVNPVLSYLDRVVYLARGRGVVGRPHDVITGPALSSLYSAPIEVLHTSDGRLVVVGHPEAASYHPHLHTHPPRRSHRADDADR
jgi:zinc/manganese transport system ATP-binding protein